MLTRHLSAALLALILASVGCSKDEKKADTVGADEPGNVTVEGSVGPAKESGATGQKPPATVVTRTSDESPKPVPGAFASDAGFEMFARTTDVIIGMNFNSFRADPAYALLKPTLMAFMAEETQGKYEESTRACGFDPITDMHSAMMGRAVEGGDQFMFVVSGMNREAMQKCMEGLAKLVGDEVEVLHDTRTSTFRSKGDKPRHVAWVGDATMIMSPDLPRDQLLKRASGRDSIASNTTMSDMLARVNSQTTLWLAAIPPKAAWSFVPIAIDGAYASIDLSEGLALKVGLRTADPAAAQQGAVTVSQELQNAVATLGEHPLAEMASHWVTKLSIEPDGNYVVVELVLGFSEYEDVLAVARTLMTAADS